MTEMISIVPANADEFEVTREEYEHYVSLLIEPPILHPATFRGTKLIIK